MRNIRYTSSTPRRIRSPKGCDILCLALATWTNAASANDTHWEIIESKYQCIASHWRAYMESPDEPVVIVVDACPETDVTIALSSIAQNNSVIGVGAGDKIVILKKKELPCFPDIGIKSQKDGFIMIPKSYSCDNPR